MARAPDRDHDEDDLEPFEEDALEGQDKADPVAAGDGLTELVDRLLVGAVLVMHGHDARRAQHGFVQPAQAEQQQQRAHEQLERRFGHGRDDELSEEDHEHRQGHDRHQRSEQRLAPAAGQADREHDRQRLGRLDRRAQEGGPKDE